METLPRRSRLHDEPRWSVRDSRRLNSRGKEPQTASIAVPSATTFAERVLREALSTGHCVKLSRSAQPTSRRCIFLHARTNGRPRFAALAEEKSHSESQPNSTRNGSVSSWRVGSQRRENPLNKGFEVEREFLKDAKLDLSGISQATCRAIGRLFSPEFVCIISLTGRRRITTFSSVRLDSRQGRDACEIPDCQSGAGQSSPRRHIRFGEFASMEKRC